MDRCAAPTARVKTCPRPELLEIACDNVQQSSFVCGMTRIRVVAIAQRVIEELDRRHPNAMGVIIAERHVVAKAVLIEVTTMLVHTNRVMVHKFNDREMWLEGQEHFDPTLTAMSIDADPRGRRWDFIIAVGACLISDRFRCRLSPDGVVIPV